MPEWIKTSAPGKLMLLGEHAVLHGHLAIVAAVDRRLSVTLHARNDSQLVIQSNLGYYENAMESITIEAPFEFVLASILEYQEAISNGLTIAIDSTISSGLGSSAALIAALQAALLGFLHDKDISAINKETVFSKGMRAIRRVQGCGSGGDLAASVFGGLLSYRMEPLTIEPLPNIGKLCILGSGEKTPTVDVIRRVEEERIRFPRLYEAIYAAIGTSAQLAVKAIQEKRWAELGKLFDINHGLMEALGISNKRLSQMVHTLRDDPGIFGVKISGAGLGDYVVALGEPRNPAFPYDHALIPIAQEGVRIEP